jgi:hypothetical protein
MSTGIRIARIVQIIAVVLLSIGMFGCMASDFGTFKATWIPGLLLILGARIYEWLSKE